MPGFFDGSFFDPEFFGGSAIGSSNGTAQAFVTGRNNQRFGYWVEDGALKGAVYSADDSEAISVFTVVASGVDDSGIAVDESFLEGGAWRVVIFYFAGGALIEAHSSDGVNFS